MIETLVEGIAKAEHLKSVCSVAFELLERVYAFLSTEFELNPLSLISGST